MTHSSRITECKYCLYKGIFTYDKPNVCKVCDALPHEIHLLQVQVKDKLCFRCRLRDHIKDEFECEPCLLTYLTSEQLMYRKNIREFTKIPHGKMPVAPDNAKEKYGMKCSGCNKSFNILINNKCRECYEKQKES